MTAKKDLKRRVRERQARTGESYVAARRAVMAEAPSPEREAAPAGPINVVELDDISEQAAALGFQCRVSIARALAAQIAPETALARLRDVVLATSADPALEPIRAVALRGEQQRRPGVMQAWMTDLRHFVARVRAGVGGVSASGTTLAVPVEGTRGLVMMVCHLGFGILRPADRPAIVLTTIDAATFFIEPIALRALR